MNIWGGAKKEKKNKSLLIPQCLIFSFKKYCISALLSWGWDKLSMQQELFSPFTPLLLLLLWSPGDIFPEKRDSIASFTEPERRHNSKIAFTILSRTLVYTGRNYCLSKRISEKNNPDLIWQGNYFSGLITLATDLNR